MNCPTTEQLAALALDAEDAAGLEPHVATCPRCQAELARLRSLHQSLAASHADLNSRHAACPRRPARPPAADRTRARRLPALETTRLQRPRPLHRRSPHCSCSPSSSTPPRRSPPWNGSSKRSATCGRSAIRTDQYRGPTAQGRKTCPDPRRQHLHVSGVRRPPQRRIGSAICTPAPNACVGLSLADRRQAARKSPSISSKSIPAASPASSSTTWPRSSIACHPLRAGDIAECTPLALAARRSRTGQGRIVHDLGTQPDRRAWTPTATSSTLTASNRFEDFGPVEVWVDPQTDLPLEFSFEYIGDRTKRAVTEQVLRHRHPLERSISIPSCSTHAAAPASSTPRLPQRPERSSPPSSKPSNSTPELSGGHYPRVRTTDPGSRRDPDSNIGVPDRFDATQIRNEMLKFAGFTGPPQSDWSENPKYQQIEQPLRPPSDRWPACSSTTITLASSATDGSRSPDDKDQSPPLVERRHRRHRQSPKVMSLYRVFYGDLRTEIVPRREVAPDSSPQIAESASSRPFSRDSPPSSTRSQRSGRSHLLTNRLTTHPTPCQFPKQPRTFRCTKLHHVCKSVATTGPLSHLPLPVAPTDSLAARRPRHRSNSREFRALLRIDPRQTVDDFSWCLAHPTSGPPFAEWRMAPTAPFPESPSNAPSPSPRRHPYLLPVVPGPHARLGS